MRYSQSFWSAWARLDRSIGRDRTGLRAWWKADPGKRLWNPESPLRRRCSRLAIPATELRASIGLARCIW